MFVGAFSELVERGLRGEGEYRDRSVAQAK